MSHRAAPPWTRRIAAGALVAFLSACGYTVWREFEAGRLWYAAARQLDQDRVLTQQEWTDVMLKLQESLRHSPRYAWSLELMGEQQLTRGRPGIFAEGPGSDSPVVAAMLANTASHLALTRRPTSAHAWANVAWSKLRLGQVDAQLKSALLHADELGPWDTDVQQRVLAVALAAWDRLDERERSVMRRTLDRALHRDAARTMSLLKEAGRLDLLAAP